MKATTIFTICVLLLSFSLVNAQWQSGYVAATNVSESRPNIDVNGDNVHIVYQQHFKGKGKWKHDSYELFYCKAGNVLFPPVQITFIQKSLSKPAIAVDGNDVVHIAVMDHTNEQVLYLYRDPGGNISEPVAVNTSDSWGYLRAVEIDVDVNNIPHIIAIGGTNSDVAGFDNLYYATLNGNGFVEQTIILDGVKQPREISIEVVGETVHIGCRAENHVENNSAFYNVYYIYGSFGDFQILRVYDVDLFYPNTELRNARIVLNGTSVHIVHVETTNGTRYVLDAVYDGNIFTVNHDIYTTEQTLFSVDATAKGDDVAILMRETSQSEDLWFKMASSPLTVPPDLISTGPTLSYFWEKIAVDVSGNIHVVCRERNETPDIIYFTNNPDFGNGGNEHGELHVASIDVMTSTKGKSVNASASVQIVDSESGLPVDNALISGVWSGLTGDSDELATGSDGFGIAKSDKINKKESGYFVFTVTNVIKSGWTYDEQGMSGLAPWNVAGKIVAEKSESISTKPDLIGNYPNPFNPETYIYFQLPEATHVVVAVFNTRGQEIRRLVDSKYAAGYHSLRWEGMDNQGNSVSSGVYLYQLRTATFSQVRKMSLLR
jgi:hypothetical protein